jgi:hypothetical protein
VGTHQRPRSGLLAERCVLGEDEWAQTSELRRAYSGWCEEAGQRALNWQIITGRLRERGCRPATSRGGGGSPKRGWRGIGVKKQHVTVSWREDS